jgi:hypothetical protein
MIDELNHVEKIDKNINPYLLINTIEPYKVN